MGIPNAKRYRIKNPDGPDYATDGPDYATVIAVLPKNADLNAYLKDASSRFDWKAWEEMKVSQNKVRIGQQKQRKR